MRIAVGARRMDIVNRTVEEAFRLAFLGIAIGLIVAYAAGRLLQTLLAGVKPWDVNTLAAALMVSIVMTFAGALFPAIRASRIGPTAAAMRARLARGAEGGIARELNPALPARADTRASRISASVSILKRSRYSVGNCVAKNV